MKAIYLKASFVESEIGHVQELTVPGLLNIQAALAYDSDRNDPDDAGLKAPLCRIPGHFLGSGIPGKSARH